MSGVVNEPLIFTRDGYMPISKLESACVWREEPTALVFSEIYKHEGEIVYQSAHVYMKVGQEIKQEQN